MKLAGSFRWNVSLGAIAFIITFLAASGNNLFITSLTRSVVAFILFYILTFLLRAVVSYIILQTEAGDSTINEQEEYSNHDFIKGSNVDWVTPVDDIDLNLLGQERATLSDEFQSFEPKDMARALSILKDK